MKLLKWLFKNGDAGHEEEEHKLPHEVYPELLEWRVGDDLEGFGTPISHHDYKGIDVLKWLMFTTKYDDTYAHNLDDAMKWAFNRTLATRRNEKRLQESEYSKVLEDVQDRMEGIRQQSKVVI